MKYIYFFLIGIVFSMVTHTATAQYCTPPNFLTGPYTGITNVIFGGISNSTSGSDGYTDYSSTQIGAITAGTNKIITITMEDVVTGTGFTDSLEVRVWIDWNQDFDFTDPGEEMVNTQVNAASGTAIVSITLAIPFSATPGTTRMRVYEDMLEADGHSAPAPCGYSSGIGQHGECEDYGITVTASSAPPVAQFNALNLGAGVVEFTDISLNSPTTWSWNFDDPTSGSNTSTLKNPTHTFATVGVSYNVCLNVSNINGNANTCNNILVTAAAGINTPQDNGVIDFQIIPNPITSGEDVQIHFRKELEVSELSVYDIAGRLVFRSSIDRGCDLLTVDTESFKPGVFFVTLEDEEGTVTTKRLVIANR